MSRICVFCGSSFGDRPVYRETAAEVGTLLARKGIGLVYGGGNVGLMGVVADAAMAAGGEVIGVIPEALVGWDVAHKNLPDLRVVASMHERKATMAELSDAFLALPGGYGTFEEFLEAVTWAQLGLQRKPCGLLNIAGYYDGLLSLIDHAVEERFLRAENRSLILAADSVEPLIDKLLSYEVPFVKKWIGRTES